MSSIIRFAIVVFCFLLTVFCKKPLNKVDLKLLRLGMFFTVIADLCLIILDYRIIGVSLFCIVQIIYIARYDMGYFRSALKILPIALFILLIVYLLLNYFNYDVDFLIFLSLFYGVCILSGLYTSVKAIRKGKYPYPNSKLILYGIILFICCDINVALSYMGVLDNLTFNLIWVFYLPSQFLLSISGYKFNLD